ncbi:hypothetical protein NCU09797 [Neurospora crassa OR74A]|uniref:Uncharacterized protein n=1 Tax=Neurospora crassa (strain ATCC 24698 / 74-OR23-1A / CBS 708.71 / DSM 1257 / FGSC 987) TaxID=367110 RepID=Q7S5Z6_NEUCR|nr:hypothetical protein NCU09797 [Neurospora crassa OR74A]EAA30959.3 hypothetical protein NCU09797 [Neurospora crassa OR74A]|eukprot:XP_960195.3 hypothetical protein NCU09797 [Neurospora crassa OR74A]
MVYRLVSLQQWNCGPNPPSPFSLPSQLLGFSCCFTGGSDGQVGNNLVEAITVHTAPDKPGSLAHIADKCGLLWHQTCGAFEVTIYHE